MWRRPSSGLGLVLLSCGPQVMLVGDTDAGDDSSGWIATTTFASGVSAAPTLDTGVAEVDVDVDDGPIIDDFGSGSGCGDGVAVRGEVCLESGLTIAIPGVPIGVAAGDLDGDGTDEVVISQLGGLPLLVVRMVAGAVTIDAYELPVDTQMPVTVGDLNDDGRDDIAATIYAPPSLVVAYGPGLSPMTSPLPIGAPSSLTYTRSDSGPALLLALSGEMIAAIALLVSTGPDVFELVEIGSDLGATDCGPNTASFVAPVLGVPGYACASVVSMVCDFSIAYDLRLDGGLGTGMSTATLAPQEQEALALVVGDVQADGRPDLFVATADGIAHHSLQGAILPVAMAGPQDAGTLAIGDFDGDGTDDLAAGIEGVGDVWVGVAWDDSSTQEAFLASDVFPRAIATGDFDGNGHDDLVAVDVGGLVAVWLSLP